MTRGKTFIVSGPSGVGKSTVLKALMEKRKNLYFSISATTREARSGTGSAGMSFWNTPSTWGTSTVLRKSTWMPPWTGATT